MAAEADGRPAPEPGPAPPRVLIADDSAVARRALGAAVRAALPGVELVEAVDGPGAYRALRHGEYDLALIDTHMPVYSGPEAVARVREEGGRPFVVLMSEAFDETWEALGREVDAYEFLEKPVDERELRRVLANVRRMRRPTRVLVVDDSRTFRRLVCRVFAAGRFRTEVEIVDGGEFALAMLRRGPQDVVFLDYAMPGVDGLEATCLIQEQAPGTPIVMISASESPVVARAARYFGAVDFLRKPFTAREVDKALHVALGLPLTSLMTDAARPGPDESGDGRIIPAAALR